MIQALSEAQIGEVSAMPSGDRTSASGYTANGRGFNVITGEYSSKGVNRIYQPVIWNLSRAQAKRIAEMTGANLHFDAASDVEIDERNRQRAEQSNSA